MTPRILAHRAAAKARIKFWQAIRGELGRYPSTETTNAFLEAMKTSATAAIATYEWRLRRRAR